MCIYDISQYDVFFIFRCLCYKRLGTLRLVLRTFGAKEIRLRVGPNPAPNSTVRALRAIYCNPYIWALIGPRSARIRSLHSARFGLADARPNLAYWRPLGAIRIARVRMFLHARASGRRARLFLLEN
jgi:hypothetical protein